MYIQRWLLATMVVFLLPRSVKNDKSKNPCKIEVYNDEIDDNDYVCDEIRGPEWPLFRWKMIEALCDSEAARAFINSIPQVSEVPVHGSGLCDGYRKQILGFWGRRGQLCWVVKHWQQNVGLMKCEKAVNCSGENTKCAPVGYARIKFLVYCDQLHVLGARDGLFPMGFEEDAEWDDCTGGSGDGGGDDNPPGPAADGETDNGPDNNGEDLPPPDDEDTQPDNNDNPPAPPAPDGPDNSPPEDELPPEDLPPDDLPSEDRPPEDGPPSRKRRNARRKSGRLYFVFKYLPQACCCRKCGCY